jgi:hypothetical protein
VPGAIGQPGENRRAAIYRRIDETLGTFDGRIRAEQDAILADRNARVGQNGGSGAGAEGDGSDDGSGTGTDGRGGSATGTGGRPGAAGEGEGAGDGQSGQGPGGDGSGQEGGMRSDKTGGAGGGARATVAGGGGAVPADVPDGRDDDVVARQIREAAMKETDPELREALWEEYRKYKKGS